jgi:hypothetical protein
MSPRFFSVCGKPSISTKSGYEQERRVIAQENPLDRAIHTPTGLRVQIIKRYTDSVHVRFPRGGEMTIETRLLRGETCE